VVGESLPQVHLGGPGIDVRHGAGVSRAHALNLFDQFLVVEGVEVGSGAQIRRDIGALRRATDTGLVNDRRLHGSGFIDGFQARVGGDLRHLVWIQLDRVATQLEDLAVGIVFGWALDENPIKATGWIL
jgi:hypothetical protein